MGKYRHKKSLRQLRRESYCLGNGRTEPAKEGVPIFSQLTFFLVTLQSFIVTRLRVSTCFQQRRSFAWRSALNAVRQRRNIQSSRDTKNLSRREKGLSASSSRPTCGWLFTSPRSTGAWKWT